jgi:peroxiredoxin
MLKSLFLSLYLILLPCFFAFSVFQWADLTQWMPVASTALLYLTPMIYFVGLLVWKRARTSTHLPIAQTLILIGLLLEMYLVFYSQNFYNLFLAIIATVAWELYVYWYSFLGNYRGIIESGKNLPQFHLKNNTGNNVPFTAQKGKIHLIFFIRGNWCPLCVAQVEEVKKDLAFMQEKGVVVDIITPQSQFKNAELEKRFSFPVRFWQDESGDAARHLGLFHRWGVPLLMQVLGYSSNTIIPAVLILDRDGKVVWYNVAKNYRVRPSVADFVEQLTTIK